MLYPCDSFISFCKTEITMCQTDKSSGLRDFAGKIRVAAWLSGVVYAGMAVLDVLNIALPRGILVSRDLPGTWGTVQVAAVALFVLLGLRELALMMAAVERGAVLSAGTIRRFRRFAGFVALSALADLVLPVVWQISAISPKGGGVLALSLDNASFLLLLLCIVTFLVSRVLELGAEYAEDSKSIV